MILLIIITAGVFLGIMFARTTDPQTFQTTVLKVRTGIGNAIVYATFGLFILYGLMKLTGAGPN